MRVLVDENIPQPIIDRLRQEGHTLRLIREIDRGAADTSVLTHAEPGELLLTEDQDFGGLAMHHALARIGILLLRLDRFRKEQKAEAVAELLRDHDERLLGTFTVLRAGHVRTRRPRR